MVLRVKTKTCRLGLIQSHVVVVSVSVLVSSQTEVCTQSVDDCNVVSFHTSVVNPEIWDREEVEE